MLKTTKTYPQIGLVNYYARKQKRIRLSLKPSEIRISYPQSLSFEKAEDFVKSKKVWILKNKPVQVELLNNTKVGRRHLLKLSSNLVKPQIKEGVIYAPESEIKIAENLVKKALEIEAKQYLSPLIDSNIKRTNLKPQIIKFRYMKTQWGSCTSKQKISLNSALIYLPDDLIEYVIIHELCHLKYLNHSRNFWQLVQQHLPNYSHLRQGLKTYPINLIITPKI